MSDTKNRKLWAVMSLLLIIALSVSGAEQPKRPEQVTHFQFASTYELYGTHSLRLMDRADDLMRRVEEQNEAGTYQATWQSLDSHALPEWFADAKFGMFIDWGLYSIPGYAPSGYPDWYLHRMLYGDTIEYHAETWGEDFLRDDFIPLFTAADYDPELLAETAENAGMKYVIPFLKHHDGFCLWPSGFTMRNSSEMGPHRDLTTPLVEACRERGLKFGFYCSIDEWEFPVIRADGSLGVRLWDTVPRGAVHTEPYSVEQYRGLLGGKIPVHDFYNQYINPQCVEFIDRYDPDILWFDGDWVVDADDRDIRPVVAYFYNQAEGRKEVAVNDRLGCCRLLPTLGQAPDAVPHGDFYASENLYEAGKEYAMGHRTWEECSGLSSSFGWNWQETGSDVRSAKQVLDMLIDVVSSGGNLLLITNLTGTGRLDPLLVDRLEEIGAWMDVNSEAIYSTRMWETVKEQDVRYTVGKDGKTVYAISLAWPGDRLLLKSVAPQTVTGITMPGYVGPSGEAIPLNWRSEAGALAIDVPDALQNAENRPSEYAWVFRIRIGE